MGDWQEQDWSNYNQNDWNNSGQVTTQLWTKENLKPHFVTCSSKSSSSLTTGRSRAGMEEEEEMVGVT